MIEKHLRLLGFSSEEIRLYNNVWQGGPSTAGRLAQRCGLTRSSIYGILDRLVQKGIVRCEEPGGVRRFRAEPPGIFKEMFARRQRELAEAQENFHVLLPQLYKKIHSEIAMPRLTMYQGRAQLQNVLSDMLLYQNIDTFSFWPIGLMVEVLSADYFRQHNIARIKRRLYTKAIWPEKYAINPAEYPWLGGGPGFMREIRIAPPSLDFTMGYWIYGAQVAVLSSVRECFGFVLESEEFARMMEAQHMLVWTQSRPLPMKAKAILDFAAKYGDEKERRGEKSKK